MPWEVGALDVMSDAMANDLDAISVHNGDPGGTGANEITGGGYVRQVPAWTAAGGDGTADLTTTLAFSGPASQAVTHFGCWSGATFRGGFALSGDLAFNASGELNLTEITIPVSNP